MPVTIKTADFKYKNSVGNYVGVSSVSERTTAEMQADIIETGTETITEVQQVVSDAQTAVDALEEQKNTIAQTVASMAQLGTDTTLSTLGMAADSAIVGTIKSALKNELIQLLQHVAYTDDQGATYRDAFFNALNALSSITAAFNQGSAVIYESTSLNDLKQYLTVTAYYGDGSTETISSSAYALSGTLVIGTSTITVTYNGKTTTFTVIVSTPAYTPEAIYTNYTATGERFSTGNISIDFSRGDYVEAVIDASSSDVVSQTNIITVAKNGSNDYLDYSTAEGVLVYKRDQSGTMKILFRIRDTANSVSIDKWVTPSDFSNIVVKLDKDGIYLNGTAVSGVSASDLSFLTGENAIAVGARSNKLSYATYNSITVYRLL